MIPKSGIIYYHEWHYSGRNNAAKKAVPTSSGRSHSLGRTIGVGLVALALGGLLGPLTPIIRLEAGYAGMQDHAAINKAVTRSGALAIQFLQTESQTTGRLIPSLSSLTARLTSLLTPKGSKLALNAKTVLFTPLTAPDGSEITPIDTNFGLIIPKIGVNAKVIPAVNPADPGDYEKALSQGVAHASTSYFPDENGTVYLFSHSTSYDWFVKDLNAVFYLLKDLQVGDYVVVYYKGKQYTYQINTTKIVSPKDISYLVPMGGKKSLILETCWPPGTTTERLLLFADLIQVK